MVKEKVMFDPQFQQKVEEIVAPCPRAGICNL